MARKIRVGVVGAGRMADRVHLQSLRDMEDVEVSAVCDIVPERATCLAAKYGIARAYFNQEEMLARDALDAVVVLVEPASLFHVARRCLEAGLPTFMEKPPGITAFQADSLARIAAGKNVLLQVGFNRRYIPLVQKVLTVVRERTTITQVEGRFMKAGRGDFDDGSVSAFLADVIHCVDLVMYIARGNPVDSATITSSTDGGPANMWNSVFRFDNGVAGTIRANYDAGARVHTFEIFGRGVSAFIDLGFGDAACRARVMGGAKAGYSLAATGGGDSETLEFDGVTLAGSAEFHRFYGYFAEMEDFIACVRSGGSPLCDIHEALKSMRMAEMLLQRGI